MTTATTNGAADEMIPVLTRKDFVSDQEVRWCPGCGDYSILAQMQKMLPELRVPKENLVFISGIGCSSRFPYYVDTYGFHTIHGRAPALATGLKAARPELKVFVITGDGDGLSIGGNHMLHILRRNLDVTIVLFNNRIYGLTKGQYSPTSPIGLRTKTSPMGAVDRPFNPISFALGCGATFVARTIDTHQKHMTEVLKAAAAHKGAAFVEIYQNCVIFNDGAFDDVADKKVRDDRTIDLEPGQKMIYGKDGDKGLKTEGFGVVRCAPEEASTWTAASPYGAPAFLMSGLDHDPEMPNPIGIFRSVDAPIFEDGVNGQITAAIEKKGRGKLKDLIYAGETWDINS